MQVGPNEQELPEQMQIRILVLFVYLLQEQLPILVEHEHAEGSMQNSPRSTRHEPMR